MARNTRRRTARATALPESADDFGRFDGPVKARWLPDGRNMALLEPLIFRQRKTGQVWTAVTGTLTDGASIPKRFWSVIGGPFEGKYRDAAVVHDYECCVKVHPWRCVDKMFYDAMRANGEEPWLAKLMYFAVYFFGPHWPKTEALTRERFKEGDIARVARLMQRRKGMDLADIEALTRKALLAQVPDIPHAVQGARALSDSKWIVPVDRDGPCVAPVIP